MRALHRRVQESAAHARIRASGYCRCHGPAARARLAQREYERKYYARMHNAFIRELGGQCSVCARLWTIDKRTGKRQRLHVDHQDGRSISRAQLSTMNRGTRIRYYMREWERGVRLRLLCAHCNSKLRPHGFTGGKGNAATRNPA